MKEVVWHSQDWPKTCGGSVGALGAVGKGGARGAREAVHG